MTDWVILTLNKVVRLNMKKLENDLDIYYEVENANIKGQKNKRNFEKT